MICLGKTVLAVFGEVHPRITEAFDIKGPAVALTVWPEAVPVPRAAGASRPALHVTDLQAVERDFAFVVDADVAALDLVRAAEGADKTLIDAVRVFDEFASEAQAAEGRKSLAITVRLQPRERTLTEAEIEAVGNRVVEKVASAVGGVLRG